ncbi:reverse transcriptase domain, reverse transcriptase zinc-binding domain protein [Tanacetum coccineum]
MEARVAITKEARAKEERAKDAAMGSQWEKLPKVVKDISKKAAELGLEKILEKIVIEQLMARSGTALEMAKLLGDGSKVFTWADNWCSLSPLSTFVSNRDIYEAGLLNSAKVNDVILNDNWLWPNEWQLKFPMVFNMPVPLLNDHANDRLVWRDLNNVEVDFSVAVAWDSIRPRSSTVSWYKLVWYPRSIPCHAIHLWLAIKRKLKTQDSLKQWDVGSNTDLSLLRCLLCNMQPDSHDHLFFECAFSAQIWNHLKPYMRMFNIPPSLSSIVTFLVPLASKKSARVIIVKQVFAASCYFIWQERNNRLFAQQRRSSNQVIDSIISTVRLKSLSCRFKKAENVHRSYRLCNDLVDTLRHVTCVLRLFKLLLEVNVALQMIEISIGRKSLSL